MARKSSRRIEAERFSTKKRCRPATKLKVASTSGQSSLVDIGSLQLAVRAAAYGMDAFAAEALRFDTPSDERKVSALLEFWSEAMRQQAKELRRQLAVAMGENPKEDA